ncbi:MAG: LysM peptidoglycan-binding domain-containing protein [Anaerolineae bacterium]|nr:LysM peptidoglycan-binding domain-containing protein [Anaerolineae bacterium]
MKRKFLFTVVALSILLCFTAGSVLADGTGTYIVQPGDSLDTIAQKFGMRWQDLAAINNIQAPYNIYIGQVLYLSSSPPARVAYYVVAPGDALDTIAQRFGIRWEDLAAANGITSPYNIFIGQVLTIPNYTPPSPPPLPQCSWYTVLPGDTLSSIGARFGVPWTYLAIINNLVNPHWIYPGQVLCISAVSNVSQSSTPPSSYHIVQAGETLSSIAQKYGLNWLDLAAINKIPPPYIIYVGQPILLYGGSTAPVSSGGRTHVVQPGEYLYIIGLRYGVNWVDIAWLNQIAPPYIIYPGQILILPAYALGG